MNKNLKHIYAVLAGIICLVIYILTLHPAVGFIDSGELAAACYTFGVPHPTGYPLFMVLGYITSHLPLGGSVIYRLNMLSALESAAAVVVTYYSALIIINHIFTKLNFPVVKKQSNKKVKKAEISEQDHQQKRNVSDFSSLFYILSFFTAICAGLTKTFWFDATQIEVYALHSLFISLIVYYSLRILVTLNEPVKKNWIMLFVIIGFSAANHSTTIYFIPAILYMFYMQFKSNNMFAKQLIPLLLYMVPGLLLYILLVISSSYGPFLNWSDVSNISNLPGHLKGSDFSQLMFTSTATFTQNAASFFKDLPSEFAIIPLVFSVPGYILLWKTFKNFIIYFLLCVIFTLLYSFNYNTIEISSFYLLVFYLFSLAVPAGILYIISFGSPQKILSYKAKTGGSITKAVVIGLLLSVFSAAYNYKDNDNSGNYANVDFTLNAVNSLKNNSVLITYDWSYLYSASLYYQLVEKIRPDVMIVNIKFFSLPWYLISLSKYYPDVYSLIKAEAEEYIHSYEAGDKTRELKLSSLITTFISKCSEKYPLYLTIDVILSKEMKQYFVSNNLNANGLVYSVNPKSSAYDPTAGIDVLGFSFRKIDPNSPHKNNMFRVIPGMYFETAYYHYNNKNFELSLKFIDKALEFDPAFRDALNLKRVIATQHK